MKLMYYFLSGMIILTGTHGVCAMERSKKAPTLEDKAWKKRNECDLMGHYLYRNQGFMSDNDIEAVVENAQQCYQAVDPILAKFAQCSTMAAYFVEVHNAGELDAKDAKTVQTHVGRCFNGASKMLDVVIARDIAQGIREKLQVKN